MAIYEAAICGGLMHAGPYLETTLDPAKVPLILSYPSETKLPLDRLIKTVILYSRLRHNPGRPTKTAPFPFVRLLDLILAVP